MTSRHREPRPAEPIPPVFPFLAAKAEAILAGDYEILFGDAEPIVVRASRFYMTPKTADSGEIIAGVSDRGLFMYDNGKRRRIVSFLYHKEGANGELEISHRAVILSGIGFGDFPAHAGQPPTWYLIGAQFGTFDPESGELVTPLPADGTSVDVKHFSVACITGGPFGEPILANPVIS
jgi:hypothetical protein